MANKDDLARTITTMSYGELKSVAAALVAMIDKEVRPKLETAEEFADLLYDWAEAQSE
jgi:hypothetical protein